MKLICRPLSTYPVAETRNRVSANFKRRERGISGYATRERVPLTDTLALLERELRAIGTTQAVIEADFREHDIRNDGWPRAAAAPLSPRVVLSIESRKHGALRYPCDNFTHWTDNLRAIALALEALRKVDRYGVTRKGEQYTGWKALPASTDGAPASPEEAARIICAEADWTTDEDGDEQWPMVVDTASVAKDAIRDALRRSHPDAGGNAAAFHRVQQARKVLAAHHGVAL